MVFKKASADDPKYGRYLAMVSVGKAKFLGDRYNEHGAKEIAVDVGGSSSKFTPNAQIRIGREFFTTALRDYEDWPEKWWREAVQNAVDAGATRVECSVRDTGDGIEVVCDDNGRGMDEDVLINKFLVLGGTTKVAGESTGGFGKAKELLVLPWLTWEVHSRDRLVSGSGTEYHVSEASERKGTRLRVLMPKDQATEAAAVIGFINKCDIKGVSFTVNGEVIKADLKKGDHLRDFGEGAASIYYNKRVKDWPGARMIVRANGIYMFGLYISDGVDGMLIIELNRPSIELLAANRDGFRNSQLRYEISSFGNHLAADTRSALQKKAGLIREKFRGSGKYSTSFSREERSGIMLNLEGVMMPAAGTKKVTMSHAQVSRLEEAIDIIVTNSHEERMRSSEGGQAMDFLPIKEVAREMFDGMAIRGATHMENALRQMAWEPDFFLMNEIEGWKVPRKFYPEQMAPRIRQLLRFWAECCRFVLIQLGSAREYGVGFMFSTDSLAAYARDEGEDWLMLNPFIGGKREAGIYSLADKDHLSWLYAAAVHESTHIADGLSYHDESFSAALTSNMAKTVAGVRKLAAIRKAIVARVSSDGGNEDD